MRCLRGRGGRWSRPRTAMISHFRGSWRESGSAGPVGDVVFEFSNSGVVLALNALRSSWSRPFPQHPRAAGGGGGHRRWRCCHRACRRRGGEQRTTVCTTRARTRQRVAPAAAAPVAAAVAAAAAAAAWRPCYSLAPPRRPLPRAIDGFFPPSPPLFPHIPPPPHLPRHRCARAHHAARPRVCAAASDDRPASVGRWLPGWWRLCLGGSRRPPRRWRPLLTLRWVRQELLAAITYLPSDEDKALVVEERAGGRYPPVSGYPRDSSGCRSCGPRWTLRRRWASAPYALVSYVRSQAAPVGRRCSTCLCIFPRVKTVLSFCKSRVFSRTRFQLNQLRIT